jgi:C_GCAxxG_C_C family probable redox protein
VKETAIKHFRNKMNCSQCILKAAQEKFNLNINDKIINMLSAVNGGLGVESICCSLIACILVLGLIFDKDRAKLTRIRFLSEFKEKYKNLNCPKLKNEYLCEDIIIDALDILEKVIKED